MRGAIQSLPSSSPGLVLPFEMNLKNFPKKLDSKTSCLRITVPENLDLALEGLIRKVLREQPKVDDIYGFAADYFDTLLKIREKAGTKFIPSQICPFHNDEDAHEMIKLASTFTKPAGRETPKIEKPKNDAKTKRKEFSQTAGKSEKKAVEKKTAAVQKKPPSTGKVTATKPERPKTLKLEPKTEDVGEDEEFLKSDPIKALVEKELMDAGKSLPKEKEKTEEQKDKPEEGTVNEDLCAVVDRDNIPAEEKKANEMAETTKEEAENQDVVKEDIQTIEEVKKEEEKIEVETQKATTEAKESENDTEAEKEAENSESQENNPEIETKNEDKPAEELQKETQNTPDEDKTETKAEEITETYKNQKELEEKPEEESTNKTEEETAEDRKPEVEYKGAEEPSDEGNINTDELCTVVDILSIRAREAIPEVNETKTEAPEPTQEAIEPRNGEEVPTDEMKAEISTEPKQEEPEPTNEKEEVKIETEVPTEAAKEVTEMQTSTEAKLEEPEATKEGVVEVEEVATEVQTSAEAKIEEAEPAKTEEKAPSDAVGEIQALEDITEKTNESDKKEESTVGPNEDEILEKQEDKMAEPGEIPTAIENLKAPEDDKPEEQMGEKEVKIDSEEAKPVQPEEGKDTREEDKITEENETTQSKETKDEEPNDGKATEQPEDVVAVDKQETNTEVSDEIKKEGINLEEKPLDSVEIKDETSEKSETTTETEVKPDEDIKPAENEVQTAAPEETPKPVEAETNLNDTKIEDENATPENDKNQTPIEETNNAQDKETGLEPISEGAQNKEPKEETEEQKQESEADEHKIKKREIVEESENITDNAQDGDKADPQETTEGQTNAEPCTVVDAEHVIKVEDADEEPQPESVQIKTIQTHYYDTLQVPEESTKEFRLHPFDNLINLTTPALPIQRMTETPPTPLSKEDSLLTPSSDYSLNLSELSVQTINEMFLDSEKQYNSIDREEKRYITKPGEKCGDDKEQQEVEEIIHKTVVPSPVGATPIAPRDDAEINTEENVQNTKQEPSLESTGDDSNEGRSIDSDTPIISVEVKTVIETEVLEEGNEKKEDDVEIRIEATIDVPEGVMVEVEEKKETKDEEESSETVPKDKESVQSSGESESSMSSTATEIKRTSKRHFSSTRTLLTTQSLDLDNRSPLLKTRSLSSFRQGVTDFEVWNAIEKELEEAATKIQSNFRGYKTRKKLQRENAVQITTEESSLSTTPVEVEPREDRQQSTGEFHDTIVLSEHPR